MGEKIEKLEKKEKKNRRGQRARQKLSETKFGKHAKHVKNPQLDANLRQQQNKDFQRIRDRKESHGKKTTLPSIDASGNTVHVPAPKPVSKETLHPSWEAKQRLKAQTTLQGFKGKKITFED